MGLSFEQMVDRMLASDSAYDGRFYTGVLTTGIYCLPSCRARKPKPANVRFFPDAEAARSFGLRACKRCHPDDFEPGVDGEEQRLIEVVERLRQNPAAFRGPEDIGSALECGASKVNALCRRFYHTSPAALIARFRAETACRALLATDESAADVSAISGYETLSSFYANFRRATGMSPKAYRALRTASSFQMSLPADYPVEHWLATRDRDIAIGLGRLDGAAYETTAGLNGVDVTLRIEPSGQAVRCAVMADTAGLGPQAHSVIRRLMGLDQDAHGLASVLGRIPATSLMAQRYGRLRVPQTNDVWDAVVWSIIGQQINLPFAIALKAALTEFAGTRLSNGLLVSPSPQTVAGLDVGDLTRRRFSQRKAEYLIDTARLVASGELPVETFPNETAPTVERRLLAVRGIGPWAAAYVMMRGCGFADCVPVGDSSLATALQRIFDLPARPGPDETRGLMTAFAPYRSPTTYAFWQTLKEKT